MYTAHSTWSSLQTAACELVRSTNLLQFKRGEDTLNICLLCHASRQGASLFAVHPLIYQMSTVGLVQFYKEQSWLSSWVPTKSLLKGKWQYQPRETIIVYSHASIKLICILGVQHCVIVT